VTLLWHKLDPLPPHVTFGDIAPYPHGPAHTKECHVLSEWPPYATAAQLSLKVMFVLKVVKRNQKTIILPHKYKSVTFWSFCIVC
jgi:hypothetical protein